MKDLFNRLNNNKHFRVGAPFLLFVFGGQYALSQFRTVRYDSDLNPNVNKFMSVKEYYEEELLKSGKSPQVSVVKKVPSKTLEEQLEEFEKKKYWDNWENKRIPRSWEGTKNN